MALGAGMSQVRTGSLSMHTKTAIHVAEIMTGVSTTYVPSWPVYWVLCDVCSCNCRYILKLRK